MEEKNIVYINGKKFDTTPPTTKRFKDLTGTIINNLEVVEYIGRLISSHGRRLDSHYRCRCIVCGHEHTPSERALLRGTKCRCQELKDKIDTMQKTLNLEYPTSIRFTDRSGEVVNGIEVLRYAGRNKSGVIYYVCRCHCGNEFITAMPSLRRGNSLSCGCSKSRNSPVRQNSISGTKKHKIYKLYIDMCRIKTQYRNKYDICPEWNDHVEGFNNFQKWAYENGYSEGKNILRKNVKLPYSPDNCILLDSSLAHKFSDRNKMITIDEYTYPMAIWAEIVDIGITVICSRIHYYGWNERDAVLTPVGGERGIDVLQYTIPEKYIGLSGCGQ